MNLIVCVDKNGGMMFNGRRQSQDSVLRAKIIELSGETRLLMSEYSGLQFSEDAPKIVSDEFLSMAGPGDFCFVEDGILPKTEDIERVYVFRWNRKYPADVYFELNTAQNGFKRESKEDFAGSSHEKITLEVYRKED